MQFCLFTHCVKWTCVQVLYVCDSDFNDRESVMSFHLKVSTFISSIAAQMMHPIIFYLVMYKFSCSVQMIIHFAWTDSLSLMLSTCIIVTIVHCIKCVMYNVFCVRYNMSSQSYTYDRVRCTLNILHVIGRIWNKTCTEKKS